MKQVGPKNLTFGKEGRDILLQGAEELTKAVASTMGAAGKYVAIGNLQGLPSRYTKDGVSVANDIVFKDMRKNMGAIMIKTAAQDVVNEVGDGTTLVSVLTNSMLKSCAKALDEHANPVLVKRGMDKAVAEVVKFIKENAKQVAHDSAAIKDVATISANNDPFLGKLIAEGMAKVGLNGRITVDESHSYNTTIELVEGIQINRGFLSPDFINVEGKNQCVLINPYIVYYDKKIHQAKQLVPLIDAILKDCAEKEKAGSILIMCDDIIDEALSLVIHNKRRGALNVACVHLPETLTRRREIMDDVTCVTGGQFITDSMGIKLEKVNLLMLGRADKAIIDREKTLIIGGQGSATGITARIENIKSLLQDENDPAEKEFLSARLAELSAGVAVLKVGGVTTGEVEEKLDRIDDAIRATRASLEEGVVPGGGSTYLHAIHHLNTIVIDSYEKIGYDIIRRAISTPFIQILTNAEVVDVIALGEATKAGVFGQGYNVLSERVENLVEAGVIDPAKVVRVALQKAASIAGMFVLTECIISDDL